MLTLRKCACLLLVAVCLAPGLADASGGIGWRSWEQKAEETQTAKPAIGWQSWQTQETRETATAKPTVAPTPDPTPEPTPQAVLDTLTVTAVDTTTAEVSWNDLGGDSVVITFGVAGQARTEKIRTKESSVRISALAPSTTYAFTVTQASTGESLRQDLEMVDSGSYRGHKFHWNLCNPYFLQGEQSFFDNSRRRVNRISKEEFDTRVVEETFVVILEGTWDKTKEDKAFDELLVMRTPGGDVYTYEEENVVDGSWDGVYLGYVMAPLLIDYYAYASDWEVGDYLFEIYIEGQFAGRAKFAISE